MQVKWNEISEGNEEQFEKLGSSRNRGENYSVRLSRETTFGSRFEKSRLREFVIPLHQETMRS